jgi:hypothetical protein
MGHESETRLRMTAFGVTLIVAAPLSAVSWLLVPTSMVKGAEFVEELASTPTGRATASLVTGTLFFPAAIIAMLGLMHLLGDRPSRVATIGSGLAITGLAINVIAFGAAGTLAEAVWSGMDSAAAAELVETTMNGAVGLLALVGVLLAAVGTTVIGICLYRARAVSRLSGVLLVVYGPLQTLGFASEIVAVITASYVVMALAFIPIGVAFMTGSTGHEERTHEHTNQGDRLHARAL